MSHIPSFSSRARQLSSSLGQHRRERLRDNSPHITVTTTTAIATMIMISIVFSCTITMIMPTRITKITITLRYILPINIAIINTSLTSIVIFIILVIFSLSPSLLFHGRHHCYSCHYFSYWYSNCRCNGLFLPFCPLNCCCMSQSTIMLFSQ